LYVHNVALAFTSVFFMNCRSTLSRRLFLTLTGGVIAAPSLLFAEKENMVPSVLDHILLGSYDLQHGIDLVEKHTGVRAQFGGVHPGRGTQNALLSLGERRYLEIIAPDPAQPHAKHPMAEHLRSLQESVLVGWAAPVEDISTFASKLRAAGVEFAGPTPGSRKRPDGRVLEWKTIDLAETAYGILPFFIEWSRGTTHPSEDAPMGCSLIRFTGETPHYRETTAALKALNLDLSVERTTALSIKLRCVIKGPKGKLEVYS
jgi:glyoxalase-like protein